MDVIRMLLVKCCNEWCVVLNHSDLGLYVEVWLKSFMISGLLGLWELKYRNWSLRWLFLYLRSYDLVGSVTAASKRGEVLIKQRMGYTKGLSAPSASELEAFDNIFDGNLTASNVEVLDALFFWAVERARPGSHEGARPPPRSHRCIGFGCFPFM